MDFNFHPIYKDCRNLLSPLENLKWQRTRKYLKGKLAVVPFQLPVHQMLGKANDLSKISNYKHITGNMLVLSIVPVTVSYDSYSFYSGHVVFLLHDDQVYFTDHFDFNWLV